MLESVVRLTEPDPCIEISLDFFFTHQTRRACLDPGHQTLVLSNRIYKTHFITSRLIYKTNLMSLKGYAISFTTKSCFVLLIGI